MDDFYDWSRELGDRSINLWKVEKVEKERRQCRT